MGTSCGLNGSATGVMVVFPVNLSSRMNLPLGETCPSYRFVPKWPTSRPARNAMAAATMMCFFIMEV